MNESRFIALQGPVNLEISYFKKPKLMNNVLKAPTLYYKGFMRKNILLILASDFI